MQDVTDEESLDVLGEEWNENKSNHHGERTHHGIAVSDPVDDDTSSVETENLPNESTIRESSLPLCGNLIADLFVDEASVLLLERREGVESPDQGGVIAFHDDGGGEEDGEHHCFLVEIESLSQCHRLLRVGSGLGLDSDVGDVGIRNRHLAEVGVGGTKNIIAMLNIGNVSHD